MIKKRGFRELFGTLARSVQRLLKFASPALGFGVMSACCFSICRLISGGISLRGCAGYTVGVASLSGFLPLQPKLEEVATPTREITRFLFSSK
jgi:hypothetical protein